MAKGTSCPHVRGVLWLAELQVSVITAMLFGQSWIAAVKSPLRTVPSSS